ncbi:MAG TPA: hypothetical protein VGI90_09865 [Steroidobacteraceae bacterium]
MKLLSKLALVGISLMGSAAYAGCNTGDSNPVECDWTVNLGSVSGTFQACLPAKPNQGIPSPVCWTFAPTATGVFSEFSYYSSAKAGVSYNNFVTFTGTLTSTIPVPPQGATPAQVAGYFPAYIIYQFESGGTGMDATIKAMTDKELLLIGQYFIANNGNQTLMAQLAAADLSATNLVRWQAAFTQAALSPAVALYTQPGTSSAYFSHPGLHAAVRAAPPPPPMPPDPFALYQTPIEEMYLEFRTSPNNNCGAVCALGKVAVVISGSVGLAWKIGTAIGTTFYDAMVYIDPSYGYDLVVGYGQIMAENGLDPPSGTAWVQNSDGSWQDQYGNTIPPPAPTNFGITPNPAFYPPYTIFDPDGSCLLLGLGCEEE